MKTPKNPIAKKRSWPIQPEQVRAVQRACKQVLSVDLTLKGIGAMTPEDQQELYRLSKRIYSEKVPHSHQQALADERARQRAEADQLVAGLEAAPPPSGLEPHYRDLAVRNNSLLAEFVKETGRRPSPEQARVVLENLNPEATLADLKPGLPMVPEIAPSAVEIFSSLENLKAAEITLLERLVEAAAAEPGLFAKRRKRAEMRRVAKAVTDKMLALPPRKRRHYEEPGSVVLSAAVFEDVEREKLWPIDVLYLAHVLSMFERRRASGSATFEDDGETLLVKGSLFAGLVDARGRLTNLAEDCALRDLDQSGWLEVRPLPSGYGQRAREIRIRKGKHALEADKRRPDES